MKFFKTILAFLGTVIAPLVGTAQTADPIIDAILLIVSGAGVTVTAIMAIVTSGGKTLGTIISYFGRKKWGDEWESKIEPLIESGLTSIKDGLNEDDNAD